MPPDHRRRTRSTVERFRNRRVTLADDQTILKVDGLSSSTRNARQIREPIMAMPAPAAKPRLVPIGCSKEAPDIL